jgi:hypothetical protein
VPRCALCGENLFTRNLEEAKNQEIKRQENEWLWEKQRKTKRQRKTILARSGAWSSQLEVILQTEFSLAGFQFANHLQNFAA